MGKNVQVVAFLQGLFHVGAIHRVLICCQDLGALPVWKQTVNSLFPEIKRKN